MVETSKRFQYYPSGKKNKQKKARIGILIWNKRDIKTKSFVCFFKITT